MGMGELVERGAFRRGGAGRPVCRYEISHPGLPGELDGFRVLHLSDLHVRSPMARRAWFRSALRAIGETPVDLVALTGDYMDHPGNERAAIGVLEMLAGEWRSRLGAVGVFGNHDTAAFRAMARRMSSIRWLDGDVATLACGAARGGAVLRVLGSSWPEDLHGCAMALDRSIESGGDAPSFTLSLVHMPTMIVTGADLALPLLLAGHTHAGQVRLSPRMAPHTSSDIPAHLASGVLRLRRTLCCVSRGMGEAVGQGMRVNCPRQVPLYVLRRGGLPEVEGGGKHGRGSVEVVNQVLGW